MIFNREPALIAAAIRAVIYAAVMFGLAISEAQLAAIMIAVEAILAVVVRSAVTPNVSVVERRDGGEVIAGPANDRATDGAVVRHLGADGQIGP